jgi:hypothetical protein
MAIGNYQGSKHMKSLCQLAVLVLLHCATTAQGAFPVIDPPILLTGDHYQLIFVSSATRDALSSNIADYDAFVNLDADNFHIGPNDFTLSGKPIRWHAIVSTLATNAKVTAQQTQPVYNLNGDVVANGGLTSFLYEPLVFSPVLWSPDGSNTARNVFTGSSFTGIASTRPAGTGSPVTVGHSNEIGETWIFSGFGAVGALPATNNFSIYALSEVLTEPPFKSLLLFAGGLCFIGRKMLGRMVRMIQLT